MKFRTASSFVTSLVLLAAWSAAAAPLTPQTITFPTLPNRNVGDPPFTLSASASSGLPITFTTVSGHWDPSVCWIAGATLTLVGPGFCTVLANQAGDGTVWAPAMEAAQRFYVAGIPAGTAPRLSNLSTRMRVGTNDSSLIAGFAISGAAFNPGVPDDGPRVKEIVVRARGRSLADFGVANPVFDPVLRIYAGTTLLATSDDWQSEPAAATIQSIGFSPGDSREAATIVRLGPGLYTVVVEAKEGAGVGTVEVFEIDNLRAPLVNLSTRGEVRTGEDVMIAGFVVQGSGPQTVVINVAGPSLGTAGVTNPLINPMLTLVRTADNAVIDSNDNWQSSANAAAIQASGFAPSHPFEPAMRVTLPPGAYTAIVQGVGGTTGIAVVGVFTAP